MQDESFVKISRPAPFHPLRSLHPRNTRVQIYGTMDTSSSSIINVKQLRQSKNLSRRKVSVALDVAESTVHRWESGIIKPHLPLEKVQIMLNLFECDWSTLYSAFQQTALEAQQSTNEADTREKIAAAV